MPSSTRVPWPLVTAVAAVAAVAAMAGGPAGGAPAVAEAAVPEPDRPVPWDDADVIDSAFAEDLWFVELAGEPTVRGGSPAEQANERAHLRAQARRRGVEFTPRRQFSSLWNGMSVEAERSQVGALAALDRVDAVHPVGIVAAPDPREADPQLATALAMTGADAAHTELALTGTGLSVAIIDTGIDYHHPDLGGHGDPDRSLEAGSSEDRALDHDRISHGWDYVGDEFDAADPDSSPPDPDPDPMDTQGHGTHVAGIVGADAAEDGGATGVAPGVTFGAYKVFATGSSTADVIVAALEDAYADGMDIVNLSLGASLQWGQAYPTTRASNNLVDNGVAVVSSAGNDADLGAWSLSAPANAHDAISVASADNASLAARTFEVGGLEDDVAFLGMTGAPEPPAEGRSDPLTRVGRACTDTLGDDLLDDPGGRTALIVRGECTFAEKYDAAVDAGATGVVIRNNVAGLFAGTVAGAAHEGEAWAAGIDDADGHALRARLESGAEVALGFTGGTTTVPNPTGGLVSSLSSYGQDLELEFGPSVMAPGGLITSTYPLAQDGYAMLSGTSMAAPHVTGAVALLWEADGTAGLDRAQRDPLATRARLQNTAEPAPWSLNPGLGLLDHSFRQGAGMVQVDTAIAAQQTVSPGQLALGDHTATPDTTLMVHNSARDEAKYRVGHEPALATAVSTFAPAAFDTAAVVAAHPETVTVGPNASAEVALTVTPPSTGLPNHQYGGYVTLTPTDDAATRLRVPYAGFAGDYAAMPLLGHWELTEGDPGLAFVEKPPRLSRRDRHGELEPVGPGASFNVRAGRLPAIEAFFGHSPQQVTLTAVEQRTGQEHTAEVRTHHPRSPGPDVRYPLVWDGTVLTDDGDRVPAASGAYTLRLDALRPLGDPSVDAQRDTWESPAFRLNAPDGLPDRPVPPG